MRKLLLSSTLALGLAACQTQSSVMDADTIPAAESYYSSEDFGRTLKFDAHVHANAADPILLNAAEALGFELLSINVDYPDAFPPLDVQAQAASDLSKRDPNRFHYATSFSMENFEGENWANRTVASIKNAVDEGAVAVKVWKNVGMTERNRAGELVMLNESFFTPIANGVKEAGVPLIGHLGEPMNCWLPVEEMTTANDKTYFGTFPQYHMYLHPELPSYEDQMSARNKFLDQNPDLPFVGAHMASLEWSVERLGEFLDKYPQATVDLAARMTQVQYQSAREYDAVRDFFITYQDRVLYGSDLTQAPGANADEFAAQVESVWRGHWDYLATNNSQRVDDIDATVAGLQLPKEVIDKIFYKNARRVFQLDE